MTSSSSSGLTSSSEAAAELKKKTRIVPGFPEIFRRENRVGGGALTMSRRGKHKPRRLNARTGITQVVGVAMSKARHESENDTYVGKRLSERVQWGSLKARSGDRTIGAKRRPS
jgi:hypothetical protein